MKKNKSLKNKLFSIESQSDINMHTRVTILGIKMSFKKKKPKIKISLNSDIRLKRKQYLAQIEEIIKDVAPVTFVLKQKEDKQLFTNYENTYSKLDPLGSVLIKDGIYYRGIRKENCNNFIELWQSGILQALMKHNVIVDATVTDFYTEEYPIILKSKTLSRPAPFFWTHSMLKEACINQLILFEVLKRYNYTLCDGHADNTRFDGMSAKWIDFGSIVKGSAGNSFKIELMQNFLIPLCMLSFPRKFFLAHRLYQSFGNKLCSDVLYNDSVECKNVINYFIKNCRLKAKKVAKALLIKNIQKPEYIDSLFGISKDNSTWSSYFLWKDKDLNDDTKNQRFFKTVKLIKKYASDIKSTIDLAGNSGYFSALMSKHFDLDSIISSDYDENAIEYGIKQCKKNNLAINYALFNFMIPPRNDAVKKLKSDIAFAFAVTHHLILTQKYNIDSIFNMITKYTNKYACIEFCPLGLYSSNQKFSPPKASRVGIIRNGLKTI